VFVMWSGDGVPICNGCRSETWEEVVMRSLRLMGAVVGVLSLMLVLSGVASAAELKVEASDGGKPQRLAGTQYGATFYVLVTKGGVPVNSAQSGTTFSITETALNGGFYGTRSRYDIWKSQGGYVLVVWPSGTSTWTAGTYPYLISVNRVTTSTGATDTGSTLVTLTVN